MAHYDFFNFGSSVCSLSSLDDKNFNWYKGLVVNYYTTDKDSGMDWQNYYLTNLTENAVTKLRTAIRWTYRGALGPALGYSYNIRNLYDGSKLSVETPILEYLHAKHPEADSLSIQTWTITVGTYSKALNCYLYKYYNSLYSAYSYTDTFNKDTGVITVTFSDPDKTVVTLNTVIKTLANQSYYYYVKRKLTWYEQYMGEEDDKYEKLYITYPSVISYQLEEFRFDYGRTSSKEEFTPTSTTVVYITYSYTIGSETHYGCDIYPCDGSKALLNQAVINDARINAAMPIVPSPCLVIKEHGSWVDDYHKYLCNKYMDKFTSSKRTFTEICDAVAKQDSYNTKNIYVITGVTLNTESQSGKRYWFTFADFIYEKWRDAKGYKDSDIQDKWYGTHNALYNLPGYLTWYDGNNVVAKGIAWTGIWKHTVEGLAANGVKKGQYVITIPTESGTLCKEPTSIKEYSTDEHGNTVESTSYAYRLSRVPGVAFRYQDSDHTYVEIVMFGLIMANPVGFFGVGWSPSAALAAYSQSCQNLGAKEPDTTTTVEDTRDPEGDYVGTGSEGSENYDNPLNKGTVTAGLCNPSVSAFWSVLPYVAGSVYLGTQNVYSNIVANVQLGEKFEIKGEVADGDSGFIIPFDLVNLNRISMIKGCDLVTSSMYVVCEYFQFDRVHFKSWKKWVAIVLQIIVVIIVIIIIVISWGSATKPAVAGGSAAIGWLAAFGAFAGIVSFMIKALVITVVMAVAKAIVRKVFGNTFLGMVFQVVLTIVAMYYTGCFDTTSIMSTVGTTISVTAQNYTEREKEKIQNLQLEQVQTQMKDLAAKTSYDSQMDLITKKMLAMSNPDSNFNVNVFINGLLLNHSQPCIDGMVPIDTWNNSLTTWASSFYEAFINDPLNVDQYLDVTTSV